MTLFYIDSFYYIYSTRNTQNWIISYEMQNKLCITTIFENCMSMQIRQCFKKDGLFQKCMYFRKTFSNKYFIDKLFIENVLFSYGESRVHNLKRRKLCM